MLTYQEWRLVHQFQVRHRGLIRGTIRSFLSQHQRKFSRNWIRKWIRSNHRGIEIGVGEQTIAPLKQTILADAFNDHAGNKSLAQYHFAAEAIPYPDQSFDFLLQEHVIEHLPNVILGLREWKRVLKPTGYLVLFVPRSEVTFDQLRPITPLAHFYEDWKNSVTSLDETHWQEWSEKVIQKGLAPHYEGYLKAESLSTNLIHRHVFSLDSVISLLTKEGWEIVDSLPIVPDRTDSFAVIATIDHGVPSNPAKIEAI